MQVVKAKLRARTTSDGISFVKDNIPLGKDYWVDLDSAFEASWYNSDKRITVKRLTANVGSDPALAVAGFMPLELLDIEDVS
jgi:hypothetical protein